MVVLWAGSRKPRSKMCAKRNTRTYTSDPHDAPNEKKADIAPHQREELLWEERI